MHPIAPALSAGPARELLVRPESQLTESEPIRDTELELQCQGPGWNQRRNQTFARGWCGTRGARVSQQCGRRAVIYSTLRTTVIQEPRAFHDQRCGRVCDRMLFTRLGSRGV